MAMKVLIADKFPDEKIADVKRLGCTVVYQQSLKDDALLAALTEEKPDVLVVRSTRVTKEMIEAGQRLSLIIRAGAGYNTIDVEASSERSVYVANCPGKNSIAVAELAFGLILSLDRRIPDNVAELRQGRWNKKEFSGAEGIFGKTLGIVGLGRIGRELAQRAKAFGMQVIAWSRSLTPEWAEVLGVELAVDPLGVAASADVVSIHLALTDETKGLIDSEFFAAMKPGAFFINTSRADVVDEQALLRAVDEKGIRAGLDVFADEPSVKSGPVESEIAKREAVYSTHHIGASTKQAQNAVADETVRIVGDYISTGRVRNCVNLMERTPAKYLLSVHHRNRVGILAGVLGVVRDRGVNVESMENVIFNGAEGACANIQIASALPDDALREIEGTSEDIYSVTMYEVA